MYTSGRKKLSIKDEEEIYEKRMNRTHTVIELSSEYGVSTQAIYNAIERYSDYKLVGEEDQKSRIGMKKRAELEKLRKKLERKERCVAEWEKYEATNDDEIFGTRVELKKTVNPSIVKPKPIYPSLKTDSTVSSLSHTNSNLIDSRLDQSKLSLTSETTIAENPKAFGRNEVEHMTKIMESVTINDEPVNQNETAGEDELREYAMSRIEKWNAGVEGTKKDLELYLGTI